MRVLVVEDDVYLGEALSSGLRFEGMSVDLVDNGVTALEQLQENAYDAVVLDRDIPGIHGDEVCRRVVADPDGPAVLMLTAAGGLYDKVAGFEIGADDYLGKPFEFLELVARLRSLGRRQKTLPPILQHGGIRLDTFRRTVERNGTPVRITRKEFSVLQILLQAGGGVVSAEILLEKAWDINANPFTNAIRVTISSLRKKLGEPAVIETVPGVGYRIRVVN
jgi:two-component system response regulator VanR